MFSKAAVLQNPVQQLPIALSVLAPQGQPLTSLPSLFDCSPGSWPFAPAPLQSPCLWPESLRSQAFPSRLEHLHPDEDEWVILPLASTGGPALPCPALHLTTLGLGDLPPLHSELLQGWAVTG